MKAVILAGGFGTRLSEATDLIPKPMVEVDGKPILWHIMKIYSSYGYNEFIVLLGYKGYVIKEYFANYFLHQSDVEINLKNNSIEILNSSSEPWKITLVDTGQNTMTGGRIKRVQNLVGDEPFFLTYGDGVSDINIDELLEEHRKNKATVTMTSVQPDGRFGTFESTLGGKVTKFLEKPSGDGSWINGGYFVCQPNVFNYIKNGDSTIFEQEPLEGLANDGELYTYRHKGFWKCMDTLKDKNDLNEMCHDNVAPWITW
ncbi:glucose-1-phosphate cytidylyltransferase [Gammaproteobacteria bacterium]|nr:glucose-1-phosphate cytidylyltransferase [Gammaproteobacteria bacterium]MDB4242856.1 glucose-1-phosphate cytidylyltransferase [Gammaproteobacteria bacterium]